MTTVDKMVRELDSAAPLWIASRLLLSEHGKEFFSCWVKAADSLEEDDIHDLRVASRRLREGLSLFAPAFPPKETTRLSKKAKKVTKMLGGVRNTDEAISFFLKLTEEETVHSRAQVEELLRMLESERDQAHKKLVKDMKGLDPKPLEDEFRTMGNKGNLFRAAAADPFMAIGFFAGGAITQRAAPIREFLPGAREEQDGAAQHKLRIAIKKLRYRLELISPLLKDGYESLHETLKEYQDRLGNLHDIDVFSNLVRERLPESAGREALLQVLKERRRTLFDSFMLMLKIIPVDSLANRALARL